MSNVKVSDKSGGVYRAVIEFTYGECERLPFNILRRINAGLETVSGGGLIAAADFNIRKPGDSAAFLEILDMFGEGGSYIHGSAADPAALALAAPPDGAAAGSIDMDDDLELEGAVNEAD
jgi:hypothetical protein